MFKSDGPSSGSIKVCRVKYCYVILPFLYFNRNKTLIFITIILESLFLLSKRFERKDAKRKKQERGDQFASSSSVSV